MNSPKHMPKSRWNDELVKECIRRLDERKSTRVVAEEMNMPANALIGKMHRLGIRISDHNGFSMRLNAIRSTHIRKHRERPRLKPLQPEVVKALEERRVKVRKAMKTFKSVRPSIPMPEMTIPELTDWACNILKLDNRHCRWPLWVEDSDARLYCGAPTHDRGPYCKTHHDLSLPGYLRPAGGFVNYKATGKVTKIY